MLEKGFFFPVKTFHLFNDRSSLGFQSLPDRSRKSVTNELFQELRKITSILLVQIIGDPYFFHHKSLTLLTIYKIWWNEKNLTVRSYLFSTFSFLVPSNSGSGCNGWSLRKRSSRMNSTVNQIPSGIQLSKNLTPKNLCTETFTPTVYFYDFRWMSRWAYISLLWPISRNEGIFPLPFSPKQSRWPPFFFPFWSRYFMT